MPKKKDILDLYFIEMRHKLIDVAAFLDRVDRHEGEPDFRLDACYTALEAVLHPENVAGATTRAEAVLLALSDHSESRIAKAPMQGALGAVPELASTTNPSTEK